MSYPTIYKFLEDYPYESSDMKPKILDLFCLDVKSGCFDALCKHAKITGLNITSAADYVLFVTNNTSIYAKVVLDLANQRNPTYSNLSKYWIYDRHPELFI